jgi:hypothetical protein
MCSRNAASDNANTFGCSGKLSSNLIHGTHYFLFALLGRESESELLGDVTGTLEKEVLRYCSFVFVSCAGAFVDDGSPKMTQFKYPARVPGHVEGQEG